METLLRRLAEWKGRRRAAQVIIFDGAADAEKTGAFLKGALTGMAVALLVFMMTAPSSANPALVEELDRRQKLLNESHRRMDQAVQVAHVCLDTAEKLEKTLASYQSYLGGRRPPADDRQSYRD